MSRLTPRLFGSLYFIASAAAGGIALMALLNILADPKHGIIFGFSLQRFLIAFVLMAGVLGFTGLAFLTVAKSDWVTARLDKLTASTRAVAVVLTLAAVVFIVCWAGTFVPSYAVKKILAYQERLQPLMAWLMLVCAQVWLIILYWKYRQAPESIAGLVKSRKAYLAAVGLAFIALLVFGGLAELARQTIFPHVTTWEELRVRLLLPQLAGAWVIGLLFLVFIPFKHLSTRKSLLLDITIFAALWFTAAVLWIGEPIQSEFGFKTFTIFRAYTIPRPPSFEIFAFIDKVHYDIIAQSMLIGEGMVRSIDKPLLNTFFVGLNLLAGQSFPAKIALQTALLAVFPALFYLLGKALHSRSAGVMLGLLAIFKELNTIALVGQAFVSSTKIMFSEVPTGLGILLGSLLLVYWLKNPKRSDLFLMASGGVLGLAMLVRISVFFVCIAAVGAIKLTFGFTNPKWVKKTLLFSAFLLASLAPWMVRNQVLSGNPFAFIMRKTHGVIIENRYRPIIDEENDPNPQGVKPPQAASTSATNYDTIQPSPAAQIVGEEQQTTPLETTLARYRQLFSKIFGFFLHNLAESFLIIPSTFILHDLYQTGGILQWDPNAAIQLAEIMPAALLLNMLLAAIGIGAAYHRWKIAGLVPLFALLGYSTALALSLRSGGRYMVPVDWTTYFYFVLGVAEVTLLVYSLLSGKSGLPAVETNRLSLPKETLRERPMKQVWQTGLMLLLFLGLGAAPVAAEEFFPQRYPRLTSEQLVDQLAEQDAWKEAGVKPEEVRAFLQQENARALIGRALYPRFYEVGEKDHTAASSPYSAKDYPKLVFSVIGPQRVTVVFEIDQPPPLPNGGDIIVLGCQSGDGTIDAVAVGMLGDGGGVKAKTLNPALNYPLKLFTRNNKPDLQCPRRE